MNIFFELKNILSILLLLICNITFAQNLISNPSFELFNRETDFSRISDLKDWYNTTFASPDYQTVQKHWKDNYLKPVFGKSSAGILMRTNTGHSEYISVKLNSELIKDSLYCFKLYVAILIKNDMYAPFGLDALLTKKRIKVFSRKNLTGKYLPSIRGIGQSYITNNSSWRKISAFYKANGKERYLTLGNFSDNFQELSGVSKLGKAYQSCYMLIDNVSLTPIHDTAECDCNIKRINLETIQNDSLTKDEKNKIIAKEGTIISLKNLYFDNDSYIIKAESNEELDRLYNLLLSNPEIKIKINGYTDNVGNEKHNQWLSEQRTKSVVDYLIQKGISKERLTFTGYGSDNPIATNETEEGRAANRRVEVEFEK